MYPRVQSPLLLLLLLVVVSALLVFVVATSSASNTAFHNGQRVQPSFVKVLTDENFEHDTQATTGSTTGDWLVLFYAPWCKHCAELHPVFDELSAYLKSEQLLTLSVAKLDITSNPYTTKRFGIVSFPTILFMKQGRLYHYHGARNIAALKSYVENDEWKARDTREQAIASNQPGDTGIPIPHEVTTFQYSLDLLKDNFNDMLMFIVRKPGGVSVLFCVGVLLGVLFTVLCFVLCLEKRTTYITMEQFEKIKQQHALKQAESENAKQGEPKKSK